MTQIRPLTSGLAQRIRFLWVLAVKLMPLATSLRARAALTAALLLLPLARLVPRAGRVRLTLPLRYDGRDFRWTVSDISELEALAEVLCDESYLLPETLQPQVIVDLGSHVGTSILYFSTRYPGARIVGVEADPSTFARLSENVGGLPGVELVNVAVGGTDGVAPFFPSRRTWGSTARPELGSGDPIQVPVRTLDSLLEELGVTSVDLLKIDVEGVEYETLRAFRGLRTQVGAIVGEFHAFIPVVARDETAFFALLEDFDVERERDGELFRAFRVRDAAAR